ncbi:ATP-binding protein [Kaistia dalseonensis]|uniref:histidine kinase n=1 Tax=Kaistia dalseonensis TaxID=410840 RepID=A0ABU0H891_9HYPH|nr:ATP-binding protein [Kaistia dalseonensis]MCX5495893.1 ATP-binding protein [Kaistia dalseonensis]MDQ0438495.1 signal transduction histidine kinase/DNA-binding LytR/AlgR family response regulator [Kaistia dalseonensis]
MTGRQRILPVRREYNRWVANQTLEDYALRFTAKSARRWTRPRVAQTAIGAISFLALEAVGGAITLSHGTNNTLAATLVVGIVLLLTGLPIARYAARYGVDIDLLTRGAGFGYIGSTITSLIYATFTFILFAIEASIMTTALEIAFGIPPWLGYVLSAAAVIPLVTHGITWISRFQIVTQPLWIILNILPVGFILWQDWGSVHAWLSFEGLTPVANGNGPGLDIVSFGAACSVILGLMPQIGEQVDILRFLPPHGLEGRRGRIATLLAGAGWIIVGAPKLLFGSFLAVLALRHGVPAEHAAEPARMYVVAFGYVLPWQDAALFLTAAFVVVSQLKINVMNAYAGSLAWSNFFSRLTHSHPGRVVWLVFNVAIALLLMELGIYKALEQTLGLFSVVAVAWLGTIVADLAINKPLGLSPPGIEFKRAHLYDINPVGVGGMGIAAALGLIAAVGMFGEIAKALAPFIALGASLVAAPAIAWGTKGRYYLARKPRAHWQNRTEIICTVCEHAFEPEDMAYCPAYSGPICSLCCSLDARCHDLCKPHARLQIQVSEAVSAVMPASVAARISPRIVQYLGVFTLFMGVISLVLLLIHVQATSYGGAHSAIIGQTLWAAFFILLIVSGIASWFLVLANESRHVAQEESARQTTLLLREIEAHRRTDAELQRAKEVAEAANLAKSRYLVGLSHELRTPLNAVFGYAQILERDETIPRARQGNISVIRRSAEHLSGLIDGLLEISRIEAGRLQLQRNEIRLDDFLDQIVDMFRFQAEAKGLGFRFERPKRLPEVVATDEKRLRQILVNLLSNAIKFTEAGSVTLKISYRSQIATLTVTDTGPGVPAEDAERIFEPFERGASATAKAVQGTGLGLTITKMLAQLMGGDIALHSVEGQGSAFEVKLMLAAVDRPAPAPPPARRIFGYDGPRRTVLVADDDNDHRELVRQILEPIGFIVLAVADGPACLALTVDIRPDLFLLDISMPGMTGWELALKLRENGHGAPIIMLSANLGEMHPEATEDTAHDGALPKPFDVRQLLDRIQALLKLDWIDEAPTPPRHEPPAPLRNPGADHVRELLDLGRIGYVRGIEAKLEQLAAEADNELFVAAMRIHIRNFDFDQYHAVLEAMGEHD